MTFPAGRGADNLPAPEGRFEPALPDPFFPLCREPLGVPGKTSPVHTCAEQGPRPGSTAGEAGIVARCALHAAFWTWAADLLHKYCWQPGKTGTVPV